MKRKSDDAYGNSPRIRKVLRELSIGRPNQQRCQHQHQHQKKKQPQQKHRQYSYQRYEQNESSCSNDENKNSNIISGITGSIMNNNNKKENNNNSGERPKTILLEYLSRLKSCTGTEETDNTSNENILMSDSSSSSSSIKEKKIIEKQMIEEFIWVYIRTHPELLYQTQYSTISASNTLITEPATIPSITTATTTAHTTTNNNTPTNSSLFIYLCHHAALFGTISFHLLDKIYNHLVQQQQEQQQEQVFHEYEMDTGDNYHNHNSKTFTTHSSLRWNDTVETTRTTTTTLAAEAFYSVCALKFSSEQQEQVQEQKETFNEQKTYHRQQEQYRLNILKWLLTKDRHGATRYVHESTLCTSFHIACQNKGMTRPIISFLYDVCDGIGGLKRQDKEGNTPLHYACQYMTCPSVIECLICPTNDILHDLSNYELLYRTWNMYGETPFFMSLMKRGSDMSIATSLLNKFYLNHELRKNNLVIDVRRGRRYHHFCDGNGNENGTNMDEMEDNTDDNIITTRKMKMMYPLHYVCKYSMIKAPIEILLKPIDSLPIPQVYYCGDDDDDGNDGKQKISIVESGSSSTGIGHDNGEENDDCDDDDDQDGTKKSTFELVYENIYLDDSDKLDLLHQILTYYPETLDKASIFTTKMIKEERQQQEEEEEGSDRDKGKEKGEKESSMSKNIQSLSSSSISKEWLIKLLKYTHGRVVDGIRI